MTAEVRPYGTWPSPLPLRRLVEGASTVGEVRVDGHDVWWTEARPAEAGRVELVRRRVDGSVEDVLGPRPAPGGRAWSARTGLLEYGGGAWCVESGVVVFAQWDDQRLHRLVADDPSDVPVPLTPAPRADRGLRYGDLVALDHRWVVAVREAHPGEDGVPADATEPVHQVVAVPTDGSAADDPTRVRVLVEGSDFVGWPRPGPARLAWVRWDHPRMPWDGTELCVARLGLDGSGAPEVRGEAVVVLGGPAESVVQPEWDREGALWASSDRSDWWNLHVVADPGGGGPDGAPRVVGPAPAELGGARWVAGMRWFAPLGDGRVLAAATAGGRTGLVLVDPAAPDAPPAPVPLTLGGTDVTVVSQVVAGPGPSQAVVVAASPTAEPTPLLVDLARPASEPASDAGRGRRTLPGGPSGSDSLSIRRPVDDPSGSDSLSIRRPVDDPSGSDSLSIRRPVDDPSGSDSTSIRRQTGRDEGTEVQVTAMRPGRDVGLAPEDVAAPEPITFPSAGGRTAHALLYRPTSATAAGPDDERPPLVVMIHGGPTSAARPMLDLRTQVWTTRGFAVVDVDYGGSTGYGRPYRRLLDGGWGVVDVEDCLAAARHLAAEGVVDGDRMVIRGGSAGGLTTLAALCGSDVFAAGTSLYGVTDLAALATDTHKLESRYLDGLVGPWPEAADVYAARSPINHLDRLATPLLVLQGADDAVVPPSQAEAVVAAVAARGLPHAYLLFEGEGHGFRRAETIVRALEAELAFYGQVLGFTPADDLPPLPATAG